MTSPSNLEGIIADYLINADSLLQKVICLYAVNKYREDLLYEISDSIADEVRKSTRARSAESSADPDIDCIIKAVLPAVLQKIQDGKAEKN